jgi:hypothetical protein
VFKPVWAASVGSLERGQAHWREYREAAGAVARLSVKKVGLELFFRSKHNAETIVLTFNAVKTTEALRPVLAACPIETAAPTRDARPFHPYESVFEESPALIERWGSLNETCRGGGTNEEETNQACEERLLVENKLKHLGCSFQHSAGEWTCRE